MRSSLLLAAIAALALCGCGISGRNTTAVDADSITVIPSARVAVDIAGDGAPSRPHDSHAVEMALAGSTGTTDRELEAGDKPVVFGGTTFNGPQQLRYRFDFRMAELAYRYRHFFGRSNVGIEALLGVGYAGVSLRIHGENQYASERYGNAVAIRGVGGIWRFHPSTSLQGRLTLFDGFNTERVTAGSRIDLQVAKTLGRNTAVRGGWALWTFNSLREHRNHELNKSPVAMHFLGPTAGLEVMF